MGTIRYTLKHPIVLTVFGNPPKTTTIGELKIESRIKGKHIRATDGATGPAHAKLLLIAALAGLSPDEADELDQEDLLAIDDLREDEEDDRPLPDGGPASGDGPPTGGASSSS